MDQHQLQAGHRLWSSPEIHEGLLTEWKGVTHRSAVDTASHFMKAGEDSDLISSLTAMSTKHLQQS